MKKNIFILSFMALFSCSETSDAKCIKEETDIYQNGQWILQIVEVAAPLSCRWKQSATRKSLDERIEEGQTGFEISPLVFIEYKSNNTNKNNSNIRYIAVKNTVNKKFFLINHPIYPNDNILTDKNAQNRVSSCLKENEKNLIVVDYGDTAVAYFERDGWQHLQCGD